MSEWKGYILEDLPIFFPPGSTVLDVGCGCGVQLTELADAGCTAFGTDIDLDSLQHCRSKGLNVFSAAAENIPLQNGSLDGILCKVVLPYTEEEQVLAEFGRLLKPGGKCYLITHGSGYYLRYLLKGDSIKVRFYGMRALVNTWIRDLFGRRLPGFLGDTTYQTQKGLLTTTLANGLTIETEYPTKSFAGFPVFLYLTLRKQ